MTLPSGAVTLGHLAPSTAARVRATYRHRRTSVGRATARASIELLVADLAAAETTAPTWRGVPIEFLADDALSDHPLVIARRYPIDHLTAAAWVEAKNLVRTEQARQPLGRFWMPDPGWNPPSTQVTLDDLEAVSANRIRATYRLRRARMERAAARASIVELLAERSPLR